MNLGLKRICEKMRKKVGRFARKNNSSAPPMKRGFVLKLPRLLNGVGIYVSVPCWIFFQL